LVQQPREKTPKKPQRNPNREEYAATRDVAINEESGVRELEMALDRSRKQTGETLQIENDGAKLSVVVVLLFC